MEQFFETLHQKKANGQLDVAIAQCNKSIASFVRGYVAYCMLKGWDCEQVILRINREILGGVHDEEQLKKDIKFYVKSIESISAVKDRINQIRSQQNNA